MNPSHDQVVTAPQLRGIPWARWFGIALVIMMVMALGIYFWVRSYTTITVAADTTYLTTPLLADGYPDYLGYWNAQNSAGVTPENNAWVAILRSIGPSEMNDEIRAEHFRLLGIAPLPEEGNYLRLFYDEKRLEDVPDEVMIAASVAAQMPYHVRFARLVALNAEQRASGIEQNGFFPPATPYFDMLEWLQTITGDIAERIELTIENPEAAQELERMEDAPEPEWDPYAVSDEEQIQDLRPAALDKIKPQFVEGEEGLTVLGLTEEAWRRNLFLETGKKLLEREDLILGERPWTEAECPLAADWVRRSTPLLDALQRELEQRPKFYAPWVDESGKQFLLNVALDSVQSLRKCAISFSYRSRYYMYHDNRAAALRDIQSIFELSRCSPQQPLLIEALVAYAIQGIAVNALGEWLRQPNLSDDDLKQVAAFLEKAPPLPTIAASLAGERVYAIGSIVSIVAREERSLEGGKDNYWETSLVCWDEVLREMNRMYDTLEGIAKLGNSTNIDQALTQAFPARPDLVKLQKERPWYLLPSQRTEVVKHAFAGLFQPAVNAARNAFLKGQVRYELARVYVALERFRRANNAYPATLAELVPAYLPAVPVDPFDSQPMKYLRTPKGGFRAYSVSANGVDDGGAPNVGDDDPDFWQNDLVVGSPDEIPLKYLFGW